MSLDEDGLNEKPVEAKKTHPTRQRLVEAEVEHSYTVARNKKSMGLPLSEKDVMALKSGKLISDLKKEVE